MMPKFTTGNIVGCGINYFKREIFFTYNGEYTGKRFTLNNQGLNMIFMCIIMIEESKTFHNYDAFSFCRLFEINLKRLIFKDCVFLINTLMSCLSLIYLYYSLWY